MVLEFLEKYQEQLISQKMELQEELDLVTTKIKENNKFIQILDSSDEAFFHEFTPRKINEKNMERLEELNQLRTTLSLEKKMAEDKIKVNQDQLIEIQKVIACEKDKSKKEQVTQQTQISDEDSNLYGKLYEQCKLMEHLIFTDPMRCRIMIDQILQDIELHIN